jgi:hypothetical protein
VEVKHTSSDAAEGLYNISVGPGLANTLETYPPSLYLPALQR